MENKHSHTQPCQTQISDEKQKSNPPASLTYDQNKCGRGSPYSAGNQSSVDTTLAEDAAPDAMNTRQADVLSHWEEFERHGRMPYCRCCGSRDLLTLERMIWEQEKVPSWVWADRVWTALDDLGDVQEIVYECFNFSAVETECDLIGELTIEMSSKVNCMASGPIEKWATEAVALEDVPVRDEVWTERTRKAAFMRLFKSFSASTQRKALCHLGAYLGQKDHGGAL